MEALEDSLSAEGSSSWVMDGLSHGRRVWEPSTFSKDTCPNPKGSTFMIYSQAPPPNTNPRGDWVSTREFGEDTRRSVCGSIYNLLSQSSQKLLKCFPKFRSSRQVSPFWRHLPVSFLSRSRVDWWSSALSTLLTASVTFCAQTWDSSCCPGPPLFLCLLSLYVWVHTVVLARRILQCLPVTKVHGR